MRDSRRRGDSRGDIVNLLPFAADGIDECEGFHAEVAALVVHDLFRFGVRALEDVVRRIRVSGKLAIVGRVDLIGNLLHEGGELGFRLAALAEGRELDDGEDMRKAAMAIARMMKWSGLALRVLEIGKNSATLSRVESSLSMLSKRCSRSIPFLLIETTRGSASRRSA